MTAPTAGRRPLARLAGRLDPDHLSDADLLARFRAERDEAAFAVLVRRHAGLVYGVCRRRLPDPADAEDAFQACFLVLARKADALAGRPTVGDWLYGVAVRVALKARTAAARRRRHERRAARPEQIPPPADPPDWFDRELSGLARRYREPVVLCLLEERSRAEAATALGIPEGTLASRLAHARKLLADRLSRRGLGVPAALVGAVPAGLIDSTAALAAGVPAPPAAARLATETMRAMLMTQLRTGVLVAVAGLAAAGGGLLLLGPSPRPATAAPVPEQKLPPEPAWMAAVRRVYELKPGEFVKRVAPPYIPERADLDLTPEAKNPEAAARNRALYAELTPFFTVFVEQDGRRLTKRYTLSSAWLKDMPERRQGDNLLTVWEAVTCVTGREPPELVLDPGVKADPLFAEKNKTVHGDFVTRKDAPLDKLAPQLERILREELKLNVRLTVRYEEQPVFVVGGMFKLNPPAWRRPDGKLLDVYATDAGLNPEYDHFDPQKGAAKAGVVRSTQHSGTPVGFVRFVGQRVNTRMVWDAPLPAEPKFSWCPHEVRNPTPQEKAADADPELVLPNVSAQTGLTFTRATRTVPVLVLSGAAK